MDFHDVINQLIGVMVLALTSTVTVVVPLLALYLKKKWGLEVDEKQRAQLTTAINNGIAYAAQQINKPTQAQTVKLTKEYVRTNAPDAVAHFGTGSGTGGIDTPQLEKKIIAQIPGATMADATAMIVPTPEGKKTK